MRKAKAALRRVKANAVDMGVYKSYYEDLPRYKKPYRINLKPYKFKKKPKRWMVAGFIIGIILGTCAYSYLMTLDHQIRRELELGTTIR